jgi:hypothetical protein
VSLIALAVGIALAQPAGTSVVLGPSTDASWTSAETWFPAASWTLEDDFLLTTLSAELDAVRPLATEFDGELEIMRRLQDALSGIDALGSEDDREILYQALVFQGFAVHRYFQDQLATDAAAAPYRVEHLGQAVVGPWAAAIALAPERTPDPAVLPEEAQRLAFDALRAQLRLAPAATIEVIELPADAQVLIDGVEVANPTSMRVLPGPHWVAVWQDGTQRTRDRVSLLSGETVRLLGPWGPAELAALQDQFLASVGEAVPLSDGLLVRLADLDEPVFLVVPAAGGHHTWRVVGGAAVPEASSGGGGPSWLQPSKGFGARVSVGGGWLYDGDYYLLHATDGAPATKATVNAVPFTAGLSANYWSGLWAVGAGVDLFMPFGEHQTLPSGGNDLRPRVYPHVSAGAIFLQLTAGWLFPWQLGLGAVAHLPLGERLSLSVHGLYGKGWALDRSPDPDFQAGDTLSAWVTLDVRAEKLRE